MPLVVVFHWRRPPCVQKPQGTCCGCHARLASAEAAGETTARASHEPRPNRPPMSFSADSTAVRQVPDGSLYTNSTMARRTPAVSEPRSMILRAAIHGQQQIFKMSILTKKKKKKKKKKTFNIIRKSICGLIEHHWNCEWHRCKLIISGSLRHNIEYSWFGSGFDCTHEPPESLSPSGLRCTTGRRVLWLKKVTCLIIAGCVICALRKIERMWV
jgi:hypothetical protein